MRILQKMRGGKRADDTDEVELLTDYLRKSRPKYFANSTEGSAYQKAIRIAKELHEAGTIERREPIGRATLYLDEGDTETRASIDEYLDENLTKDGKKKKAEEPYEEVELLTDYLRETKPKYFSKLPEKGANNKAAKIAKLLHKAGKIKKREPVGRSTLYLDEGDTKTRKSIDAYLDENLTKDGIKKIPEGIELLTEYLRKTKPTYFSKIAETSAYHKAIKIAKLLHEAGKIKRRKPIRTVTLYLDEGDTKTRKSIDAYLDATFTEDGKKKRTEEPDKEVELLTAYLRETKPKYFAHLSEESAKSKARKIAKELHEAGKIERRDTILRTATLYLDEGDKKTRKSIDAYLDENLTEDGKKKRADDTDEVELLTDYLRKSRPKYFANSSEGGAYQKAIRIAKELHEAGKIKRRKSIGKATLYLDEGDEATRASIDEYLGATYTEDGKKKRTEEPDKEVELLTEYLREKRPTYFTGLTERSARNKAERLVNEIHEAGIIEKRDPIGRATLYLDEGDKKTRKSIDEHLDTTYTEDGKKKRTEELEDTDEKEEVELLTDYLRKIRPTYFSKLTKTSAYNKAVKIAKDLHEAGIIEKREPIRRVTLYLDEGDTETRASITEYLDDNLTEDGKKKIIVRSLKEQSPKEWEDVGGVERTDDDEPDENDLSAMIDESDEHLEEYESKVRKRSQQPSLAGRVKKKATRAPRKVDPIPDFETIGHFIESERPDILGLHTTLQEKVRILDSMIKNMENNGVVEKRPEINEAEYYLLDHEDDKRARILDYLDNLSRPTQAVEQRKPEHDGTVASYLTGRYLSGLDKKLQLRTLDEWIKNLNEEDIIEDGEDPLSPELQNEIDGYIEHLKERAREDPSPQQRTEEDPPQQQHTREDPPQQQHTREDPPQQQHTREDPPQQQHTREDPPQQQRIREDPSQCTLEDIAEKIGIPVAIVESYNCELIGMSINRNMMGRIVSGIRSVTDSYDGELMSMENIVEETRIPLKYLKWFDMRILGKYIQVVQNGKKICEGWDSAHATKFIASVRMPRKGESGYNTPPAKKSLSYKRLRKS